MILGKIRGKLSETALIKELSNELCCGAVALLVPELCRCADLYKIAENAKFDL